jgi:4-alpha-glucanotransferase
MKFKRSAGTLVHPTSFPSDFGIGDLGKSARQFIDFLVETDQSSWQVLPLCPTGYGNSPYASYSAFAGNHYLIDPYSLVERGYLDLADFKANKIPQTTKVPYEKAFALKDRLFNKAFESFKKTASKSEKVRFEEFKKKNTSWLSDYAMFMAAFEHYGKVVWNQWDADLASRKSAAMKDWKTKLAEVISYHEWLQFEFFSQWQDLRAYANNKGISIIGDIPIFVDHNSADVWANPHLFEIDKNGNRVLVAGVPPDYFSETGQLWGNPLYKWDRMEKEGYTWWIDRFRQMLQLYDSIRVDHFRGFDAYWEIKATEKTAIQGRWVKGPGAKLFKAIIDALGELPIIAEDLGVLTREVIELRDRFNFPGMKILQFAFNDNAANSFLPHNFESSNCVVYTGTHDNDTTLGWYEKGTDLERHRCREYTRSDGERMNWELIRLGYLSVADQCIVPLQDFMNLDTEHRMNYPGLSSGMWEWRYTEELFSALDRGYIKYLVNLSNRNTHVINDDSNLVEIKSE